MEVSTGDKKKAAESILFVRLVMESPFAAKRFQR